MYRRNSDLDKVTERLLNKYATCVWNETSGYICASDASGTDDEYCLKQVNELISTLSFETSCTFTTMKATKSFGKTAVANDKKHCIRWKFDRSVRGVSVASDNIPFVVVGKKVLECQYGPQRRETKATKRLDDRSESDRSKQRKEYKTKKLGCRASIHLQEIFSFPEYHLSDSEVSKSSKHSRSRQLSSDLDGPCSDQIVSNRIIVITLPKLKDHSGHAVGEAAEPKVKIDKRVVAEVNRLVRDKIYRVDEISRRVELFVNENLVATLGRVVQPNNRHFYPNRRDVRRLILEERIRSMNALVDKDLLTAKISEWTAALGNSFYYSPFVELDETSLAQAPVAADNDDDDDDEVTVHCDSSGMLLVFQTSWQKRLLMRYGGDVCFLDGAHKTIDYDFPLFFLSVRTNVGHCVVVATMIMQNTDLFSLAEALNIVKEWNCDWKPTSFVLDVSEVERELVTEAFPGCSAFISDFHRQRAWKRWTAERKNGLSGHQDEILHLLNNMAHSLTFADFNANLKLLEESFLWKRYPHFQNYVINDWLKDGRYERWICALQNHDLKLILRSNDGLEAQKKFFEHKNLRPHRSESLTDLVTFLLEKFLPDSYQRYITQNVASSSRGCVPWNNDVPTEDLQNRPSYFVNHMQQTMADSKDITREMVETVSLKNGLFKVQSVAGIGCYEVSMGSDDNQPSCECRVFQRSHLPCKHLCAIFSHVPQWTFGRLPDAYRNNPLFVVDVDCLLDDVPVTQEQGISSSSLLMSRWLEAYTPLTVTDKRHSCDSIAKSGSDSDVESSAQKCRDLLSRLDDLTYHIRSRESLDDLSTKLEDVVASFSLSCDRNMSSELPRSGFARQNEEAKRTLGVNRHSETKVKRAEKTSIGINSKRKKVILKRVSDGANNSDHINYMNNEGYTISHEVEVSAVPLTPSTTTLRMIETVSSNVEKRRKVQFEANDRVNVVPGNYEMFTQSLGVPSQRTWTSVPHVSTTQESQTQDDKLWTF